MPVKKTTITKKENIFLLMGENDYELKKFLKKWERSALDKYGEFNVSRFNYEDREVSEILGEINAPPFFGNGKRIFFIENFPPPPPSRTLSAKKKEAIVDLTEALVKLEDDSVVVLAVPNPDKRTSAFKKISPIVKETKLFESWPKESSGTLKTEGKQAAISWIQSEAKQIGGEISTEIAGFLIEFCGPDPWKLSAEIRKIILYSNESEKTISPEDIQHLCIPDEAMANFAFSSAASSGKVEALLEIFRKLIHSGEAPQAILMRDLAPTIRQLLQIRTALDHNISPKEAGIHPFVFGKMKRAAEKISLKNLLKAHTSLLKIDTESKNGLLPITPERRELFQVAIEKMLLEMFGKIKP